MCLMIRACRFCYDCSCHSHYCNTVHCLYDYSSFSTMTKESMASSPFFHSKHFSSFSLVPSSFFWMCKHNFSNNSSLALGRLRLLISRKDNTTNKLNNKLSEFNIPCKFCGLAMSKFTLWRWDQSRRPAHNWKSFISIFMYEEYHHHSEVLSGGELSGRWGGQKSVRGIAHFPFSIHLARAQHRHCSTTTLIKSHFVLSRRACKHLRRTISHWKSFSLPWGELVCARELLLHVHVLHPDNFSHFFSRCRPMWFYLSPPLLLTAWLLVEAWEHFSFNFINDIYTEKYIKSWENVSALKNGF